MNAYKILSILLEYPAADTLENIDELCLARETASDLSDADRLILKGFLFHLRTTPLTQLQADYVQTFDLTPEHSLHITHHLFGDDNRRGPALIDLAELYREFGLEPAANELPDYLPLMLEFASQVEPEEAGILLADIRKVISILYANLLKAGSPWAPLFRIIESRADLTRLAA